VADPIEWSPPTVRRKSFSLFLAMLSTFCERVFSKGGKISPLKIGNG